MTRMIVSCSLFSLFSILGCEKPAPVSFEQPLAPDRYSLHWEIDHIEPSTWINALTLDSNGQPWVGLHQKGIARFDGVWEKYNAKNSGLPVDEVLSIAVDDDDGVWFGTTEGIAHYASNSWQVFNPRNSPLLADNISALAIDRDGLLWIGCSDVKEGGVMSFDAETWRTFTAENSGFPSRYPMKIVAGEQNTLWVATRSSAGCPGGLARYENGQWVSYTPENSGLPYPDIYDISIDSHGNLWLATHEYQAFGTYVQSALVKFDGNVAWEIISHNRNAIITALGHTGDDRLWIATSSNPALSPMTYDISVLEDGKQIRLSTLDHRFPLPYTFNIIVDTTGRTWLATTIGLLTVKPFPLISQ